MKTFKKYIEEAITTLNWNQFVVSSNEHISLVEKYLKSKGIQYDIIRKKDKARFELKSIIRQVLDKALEDFKRRNINIIEVGEKGKVGTKQTSL